jgi:hypothetical protein
LLLLLLILEIDGVRIVLRSVEGVVGGKVLLVGEGLIELLVLRLVFFLVLVWVVR